MVGSKVCYTYGLSDQEKVELDECDSDKGGYFIINGSEKVIVGQEKDTTNLVEVVQTNLIS